MKPIEVTVNFDTSGNITPLYITCEGIKHKVERIGRHWQDDAGHFYIVMIPVDKTLQIHLDIQELRWYLILSASNRNAA